MTTLFGEPKLCVVGVGDMKTSADRQVEVVTYALGSCLCLVVYDPVAKVVGMLHAMLPEVLSAPHREHDNPAMFVDLGIPLVVRACLHLGARSRRLVLFAAGGANMGFPTSRGEAGIGERNITAMDRALADLGLVLSGADLGGTLSRKVSVSVATGATQVSRESGVMMLRRTG
ncbi:MAG: chemotaxis protein CheD [Polyangiaceae bacterium]